jgi:AraC-like DNA-binding protein
MATRDFSRTALPLETHPAMRAKSIAGVEEAISREFAHVQLFALRRDVDGVDARANHCVLSKVTIWSCRYTVPMVVGLSEAQSFGMRFQRRGSAAVTIGRQQIPITPRSSCIVSHGIPAVVEYCRDYEQVMLRVDAGALKTKLAAIAGHPIPNDIVFQPDVDLQTPAAKFLRAMFDAIVQLIDQANTSIPSLALAELEQALMVAFLASNRHNYSHWMEGVPPSVAPWQVRRAEDYIEANWHRPLEVEAIAAETGTSGRSLFRAFKQSRGYSPLEFIKHVRLQHAREMVEKAQEATTVMDIALATGFGDHGRFSKAYRQRFGELPSAALARTKGVVRSN